MPLSEWFFLVYGAALFYLLMHLGRIKDRDSFRYCWFFFVGAIFAGAFSGNQNPAAENFSAGDVFRAISWLLVVVSAVFLYFSIDPIFPDEKK